MFERFTERARQVVVLAQDEARTLKHNYIGTEHLLLGLLREEEGLASRVLESLDITIEEVRAQVMRIVGEGDFVTLGQIPFTPRAKKVLELSLREALRIGHNYIGTEHILLGLLCEDEGVGARILADFDADAEKIRNQIMLMLSGQPSSPGVEDYPSSPPVPAALADEIKRLSAEKQAAIEEQEFEKAAALRERERRLRRVAREFHRPFSATPTPIPWSAELTARRAGPMNRRRPGTLVAAVVGWALFGVAAGIGVLVGWLIWG